MDAGTLILVCSVAISRGIRLLPYQAAAVNRAVRLTWTNWARQTGKSTTFALRRIVRAVRRGRLQVLLSARERQSRELMAKVANLCGDLGASCHVREARESLGSVRKLEARLAGMLRLVALPANPMTARGYSGDLLLDEFSMHRDDGAIWAALFPSLLRGSGELDVASTPRGRKNAFHRLLSNALFTHETMSVHEAIERGLAIDVESLRESMDDPVAFRQEFECEFVDEATAFIPHELITRCQDASVAKRPDEARLGTREAAIYVGVDVGRVRDLTVIWIWEAAAGGLYVTRGVIELAGAPFAVQRAELERLLGRPAVRRCAIDRTGLGAQLAEELAARFGEQRVEAVNFTAEVKSEMAGRLRVLAERAMLRIPVDEAIRRDWHSLARIVTTAGNVRFEADRGSGGHSDRFWAAALGLQAARRPGGVIEYVGAGAFAFGREGAW